MKSGWRKSRRLEQVFQDLEDGVLNPADHSWLMEQMRNDPDIRRAYRDHMSIAVGLSHLATQLTPHQPPAIAKKSIHPARKLTAAKRIFAVAAAITLMAVAVIFRPTPPEKSAAKIDSAPDASWKLSDGGLNADGDFIPGTRLSVDRGAVEVKMPSGTRFVLEGPAELEIHQATQVTLARGSGWFEIAPVDHGFEVHTSRLRVIDLGTRFGVSTGLGKDRIEVGSGKVQLQPTFAGVPSKTLTTGQAAVTDLVGRATLTTPDPGLFLQSLQKKTRRIHWNFDSAHDNAFPAETSGTDPAPIRIANLDSSPRIPRTVAGPFGSALDLTDGESFGLSDFPGFSGSGPRTVALWVKGSPIPNRFNSRGVDYVPSVVMWGDPQLKGASWTLRAHCRSGVIGTQWSIDSWQTAGNFDQSPVLDETWHHIASVYTGKIAENGEAEIYHYIDGKRVAIQHSEIGTDVNTWGGGKESARLRIGLDHLHPGGPANVPVAIDELYIVRGVLTDRQIEALFRENRLIGAD